MSANFAFVNYAEGGNDSSGSTWSAAAANHTTGNLIIAVARWEGGGTSDSTTVSFSDTASNSYTIHGHKVTGGGAEDERIGVGYVINATGNASNVVQAVISGGSRTYRRLTVASYSYDGTVQISSTDGEGVSTTNTGTVTTDTSLSAVAGDLSVLAMGNYNGSTGFSVGDSFTERGYGVDGLLHLCDLVGTYSSAPGGTFSTTADTYVAFGFSFESTGGIQAQAMHHYRNNGKIF